MTVAAILGSAFDHDLGDLDLEPVSVVTPRGPFTLHRLRDNPPAYLSFRHGLPHQRLPHHIDFRAQALALAAIHCQALLVTSSVGVLDPDVPLYTPALVDDLLMLDNHLPCGAPCTIFEHPSPHHGHLVLQDGLLSSSLNHTLRTLARTHDLPLHPTPLLFAYVPGPRTKTRAENLLYAQLGAHVNSMSLAPEVVLANELEIPTAALVVGHKASGHSSPPDDHTVRDSLTRSRHATLAWIRAFLQAHPSPTFANTIYRFQHDPR